MIPENWCWVKLGELCTDIQYGYTAKAVLNNEFPKMLRITDVQDGCVDWETVPNCNIDETIYEKYKLVSDDIVFARTGATTGKSCLIENPPKAVYASYLIRIRLKDICNVKYIFYSLQSDIYWKQILELSSGIAQPGVNSKKLRSLILPLPPLTEQHRIVTRIESLFAKLDETKEKAQAVVDGFELRKAAILHRAFSGELTERWRKEHGVGLESWKSQALGLVTENHDAKRIHLSQKQRENMNRRYNYYGASGVIDQVEDYLFEGRYLLIGEDGANLVTRSKPIAFIADGQYWVNNHAHVLATKSHMIMDFLCYYINSVDLIPYVTGSAQPKLTQNKMNKIPIPVPSVQEQEKIVYILGKIFTQEQHAKEAAETVLDQIDTMKKAILARAFRGELGTNDPAEEWAGELVREVLKSDTPKQPRSKAVFLPKELEMQLESELERKIVKLYLKNDSETLAIEALMAVSSKKFEIINALRNLEQKGIIKKVHNGNYNLVR